MSLNTDLNCRDVVELVTDFLEGRMSGEDRGRFEEHLNACSGCRAYLDQMRMTVQMLGKLDESALPEHVQEALVRAFRTWKRQ